MSKPVVVIPTLEPDSIASRALRAELVMAGEWLCTGSLGYAHLLASAWYSGGFIVVEHDIAPWPGAIQQLWDCPNDWCMFRYPKYGQLTRGLGCTKFSDRLTTAYPNLPDAWEGTDWRELDGAVGTAVNDVLRAEDPKRWPRRCMHTPPVAHVRQWP